MIPGGGVFFEGKKAPVRQPRQPHGGFEGFPIILKALMINNMSAHPHFHVFGDYASLEVIYH